MKRYFLEVENDLTSYKNLYFLDTENENEAIALGEKKQNENHKSLVSLYVWWGCKSALETMLEKYDWFTNMEDLTYYGLVETDYSECEKIKDFYKKDL